MPVPDLRNNSVSFDNRELVRIITCNIPGAWEAPFKLVSSHKSATVTKVMKVINYIKKKDRRTHKSSGNKNERNKPPGG